MLINLKKKGDTKINIEVKYTIGKFVVANH